MIRIRFAASSLLAALAVPPALGADVPPAGALSEEYRTVADDAGAETEMRYPDAFDPAELVDAAAETRVERPEPEDPEQGQAATAAIFGALALLAVAALFTFGGMRMVSFRKVADRSRRLPTEEEDASTVLIEHGGAQNFLARLRSMSDRRAALVLLIQGALERSGELAKVPVLRSQTAREVLRRLPAGWRHHDALGRIVRVEEVVQFGGRDLPEDLFLDCLARAEPIFAERVR